MPELTLTHPDRLWWLLLLLPLLLLLAWPPRPRRIAWTAHLPQWRTAMAGLRRRPPRVWSLRTLLMLLIAGFGVFAAAGLVRVGQPGPDRLVVALDASASMAARTATGETAFELARRRLASELATLPEHVDVTVLRCGGPALRRRGASARALQDLGPAAGAQSVDLAALAREVVDAGGEETVLWTLTDGQGQRALPASGALSVLGSPVRNAAVLEVRLVDHWPLPELELEADFIACGDGALEATVGVAGAIDAVADSPLALQYGEVQTVRWSLRRVAAGGRLSVTVALAGDALAEDDRWTVQLPPLPAPRIAVLADEEAGPFAVVAAAALAAEVGGEVVPAAAGAEVGLLLVDGGEVALAPGRARALCFGSRYPGGGAAEPWLRPGALDWARDHPLTAGLDLSELQVEAASAETLPAGEPFLFGERAGERRPLAVVSGGDDLASVHFAFRLQDGNLPLLAAFPQLLRRSFVRCYGSAAAVVPLSAPPAAGEQDLWQRAAGRDRPLPALGTPDLDLGPWLILAGLLLLAVRAWLR